MKVSIIIPVYNEEKTFDILMKKVLAVKLPIKKEILIVEGLSTDKTPKIVDKYKDKPDVKVFHVTEHRGKGYKVRYGIKKSTGDIILIQDADLEYDPGEYPELLAPIIKGKAKFVMGSRHLRVHSWKIRKFARVRWSWQAYIFNAGAAMIKWYFTLLYRVPISDPDTMYKIFRKDCLKGITLKSNGFDLDMEIIAKLIRKGYKPVELPVSYKGRSYAEGKKIRMRDGFRHIWAITKYRFLN